MRSRTQAAAIMWFMPLSVILTARDGADIMLVFMFLMGAMGLLAYVHYVEKDKEHDENWNEILETIDWVA